MDKQMVMFWFRRKARGKSEKIYNFNLINLHKNCKVTCSTTNTVCHNNKMATRNRTAFVTSELCYPDDDKP